MKTLDIIGKIFGKLVVKAKVEPDKNGLSMFLVQCECGRFKEVRGSNLVSGRSSSCGCGRYDNPRRNINKTISKRYGRNVATIICRTFSHEMKHRLTELAKWKGVTVSETFKFAVAQFIEREEHREAFIKYTQARSITQGTADRQE